MKKLFITTLVATLFATALFSENTKNTESKEWTLSGLSGINFSQTSLINWSAGGENSLSGNIFLNSGLVYKKDNLSWESSLALDYGLSRTDLNGVRKNTDKIDFSSKFGVVARKNLYYTLLLDLKSQFAKGYNYPNTEKYISSLFAPAYSSLSLGLDYIQSDKFSLYFSPATLKSTFVLDKVLSDAGAFGVEPGKKMKVEGGIYLKTEFKTQIMENVSLLSKADFFTAYDKSFGNIDINWDMLISMKINSYLNATISTSLKYDDDVKYIDEKGTHGARIQFKEILGIGLAYKF